MEECYTFACKIDPAFVSESGINLFTLFVLPQLYYDTNMIIYPQLFTPSNCKDDDDSGPLTIIRIFDFVTD